MKTVGYSEGNQLSQINLLLGFLVVDRFLRLG